MPPPMPWATAPNTYANKISCISGWIVENTISRLLRSTLRRLRPATSAMSAATRCGGSAARRSAAAASSGSNVVVTASAPRGQPAPAVLRLLAPVAVGHVAVEAQEHVVERRPPDAEV